MHYTLGEGIFKLQLKNNEKMLFYSRNQRKFNNKKEVVNESDLLRTYGRSAPARRNDDAGKRICSEPELPDLHSGFPFQNGTCRCRAVTFLSAADLWEKNPNERQ